MTGQSHRSFRLLQTILLKGKTTQIQHPFHQQLHLRTISSSCQCQGNSYSVSYGAEIDTVLNTYNKSTKRVTKSSGKTRSPTSRAEPTSKAPLSTGAIEIILSDDDGEILATKPPIAAKDESGEKTLTSRLPESPARRTSELDTAQVDPKRSERSQTQTRTEDSKATKKREKTLITKSEPWQIQKDALERKFGGTGWSPRKKLSPDAIQGLRDLHTEDPERYSTSILAEKFKVSPEAIRRILKSKWRATAEEMDDRRQRWARRHDRIWDHKAALGQRPRRQKDRVPEGPEAFEEELRAKQMLGQI